MGRTYIANELTWGRFTRNTTIPFECWFLITVPRFLSLKVQLECFGLTCGVHTLYSTFGTYVINHEHTYGIAPGRTTFFSEGSLNISVLRQVTPSRPFHLNLSFSTFALTSGARNFRLHYIYWSNGTYWNTENCTEKVKLLKFKFAMITHSPAPPTPPL